MVLTLWARLPAEAVSAEQQARFGRQAGLRWGVSRAVVEFLAVVAQGRPALVEALRGAQADVNQAAEAAMQASLEGRVAEALDGLMDRARHTRNARLIEMVAMLARRHRDVVDPPLLESLVGEASDLLDRYRQGVNHIAGIQRSQRSPGGLIIRS